MGKSESRNPKSETNSNLGNSNFEFVSDFGFRASNLRYWSFLLLIAVAAFAIVLFATRWGIATSSDSARYIRTARHILGREADGPTPIFAPAEQAHFPPLYPNLLALASLGGNDPLDAARWVHALLMAANVVVAAELVRRFSGSIVAALFVAALMAVSPTSVFIHTWALSEALYFLLTLLSLGLLTASITRPRRTLIVAAALLAGAGMLTRYAGVAIIPAGAIALLLVRERRWGARVVDATIFVAIAGSLPAAWSVRNAIMLGSSTNRVVAFHPIGLSHLADAARTFCGWFYINDPTAYALPVLATLVVGVFLVAGALIAVRKLSAPNDAAAMSRTLLLFIVCFAVMLAWSISFVDYHTPVDERILAPVWAAWVIVIGVVLATANKLKRPIACATWGLAIALALVGTARSAVTVRNQHNRGGGFAHTQWRNSPTLAALRELPRERILYSNAPGVIYLLTNWPVVISLPTEYNASSRLPDPDYPQRLAQMREDLQSGRAVLVYLDRYGARRWRYPSSEELEKQLALHPLARRADGVILDYVPSATTPATAPATKSATSASATPRAADQ